MPGLQGRPLSEPRAASRLVGRRSTERGFKVLEVLFLAQVSPAFFLQRRHVGDPHFGTFEFANSIRPFSSTRPPTWLQCNV
jgi:hypothetical protein